MHPSIGARKGKKLKPQNDIICTISRQPCFTKRGNSASIYLLGRPNRALNTPCRTLRCYEETYQGK